MLQLLSQSTQPSAMAIQHTHKINSKCIHPVKQKAAVADDTNNDTADRDEGANEKLALFQRQEIKVGELVGTGSFSEVYEISSFDLIVSSGDENDVTDNTKRRKSASFLKTALTPKQPLHLCPSRRKRHDILIEHNQNTQDQMAGRTLQSRYVIKHLHSKLLQDPKLFKRAVRDMTTEATLMQDMNHPHIARLRGTALNGPAALEDGKHDSFFLVLDRLHETLDNRIETWNSDKIQQGPSYYLDSANNDDRLALKVNYAWQIASALQYLHKRRIIFRDLKPQNIGFKEIHPDQPERDVLALFDFGLARNLPAENRANKEGLFHMSLVGTRRYMAPEVVLTKTYNERADTYSWALVFFEMVTQQRPYDGIQRNEHKEYICTQGKRPKLYSYYGLPKDLETMLRLSWAQDVSKRWTMSEVCETLKAFLAGTIHANAVLSEADVDGHDQGRSIMRDTSFSSNISTDTYDTEQSVSTADPSTTTTATVVFEEANPASVNLKDLDVELTKDASPDAQASVPQAIKVTASGPSTGDDASYYTADFVGPKRRVSLCERFLSFFRTGLANKMRLFHH